MLESQPLPLLAPALLQQLLAPLALELIGEEELLLLVPPVLRDPGTILGDRGLALDLLSVGGAGAQARH